MSQRVRVVRGGLTGTTFVGVARRPAVSFGDGLFEATAPANSAVYITRISAAEYHLYQDIGLDRFVDLMIKAPASVPGAYTPTAHYLDTVEFVIPYLLIENGDASIVTTGAGWTTASGHIRTSTTGDFATFTTPADTTVVGVKATIATNCGYALVTVNGSTTAANLCNTAQTEVDAGRLASTVLVANGGTLNPTDRVIQFHTSISPSLDTRLLVDGLAPGVHTVVLTATGYKVAAASDVRILIDAMLYHTTAMVPTTASILLFEDKRLFQGNSAYEFAYRMEAGASVEEWAGQLHGYEKEISFTIEIDGVVDTLTDGEKVAATTDIVFTRVSELYHPAIGAGATKTADTTVVYTIDQNGWNVAHSTTWLQTLTPVTAYPAMFPCWGWDTTDPRYESFARGSGNDIAVDKDLSANDGASHSVDESDIVWFWSPGGRVFAVAKIDDIATALQNFTYSGANKVFLEDRPGPEPAINKQYYPLMANTVSPGTMPDVVNGTVWACETTYRYAMVDDADAVCSRGL